MQGRSDRRGLPRDIDWQAAWVWLLALSLVVYLGLKGGGYDPLVHDQVGIAVWWVLLATVAVGALPRRRPTPLAWVALGLLAAFVAWTALSLSWTESVERTWADLARVAGYLGVFALALFVRDSRGARRMVAAVGTGIAVVALVGLLSRFHPSWFPAADETARILGNRERLAYPLHYWNAVAALIAIGLPLLLQVATGARSLLARSLAAAALPALALTVFYTLSRGGSAAAVIGVAVFLAFTSNRPAKLPTLLITAAGGAALILAADSRQALQEGLLTPTARDQGDEMLLITIAVCAVVFLCQTGISLASRRWRRPRWTEPSRRASLAALASAALVLIVAAAAWDAPGRVSDAWSDFKEGGSAGEGAGRLTSAAGQSRYQYWSSAVREARERPLAGTGSGTFEFWWTRDRDLINAVRDTHSLYLQTLGELGIVGLALLAAFLAVLLGGGAWVTVNAGRRGRPQLAAALAGCVAFFVSAIFDWMWQIPVLPVATLLLAAPLVSAGPDSRPDRRPFPWAPRLAVGAAAIVAIVAIAVPLASESLTRQSQDEFRSGDLSAALSKARSAQNVEPAAATPRLQQALVLESLGTLGPAAAAARAATERESTNWRTWLVLSRLEAERGNARGSLRAYRQARSLNPGSSLFTH